MKLPQGWLVTYYEDNDSQALLWLDENGGVIREQSEPIWSIVAAYPCGTNVYLVHGHSDGAYLRLIAHTFDLSGTLADSDTLFSVPVSYEDWLFRPAVDAAADELLIVLPVSSVGTDTTTVTAQAFRFTPEATTVGPPWELRRFENDGERYSYVYCTVDREPMGNGIFAYSRFDFPDSMSLSVQAFDENNEPYPALSLGEWALDDHNWACRIAAVVANESVYACCVKEAPDQPWLPAVYVEAFPLSEILKTENPFIPQPSSFSFSIFPNPFNASTQITFDLPRPENVQLTVTDITGRTVTTLADKQYAAGTHMIEFDGRNRASGIYIASLRTGTVTRSQKMILLK